MNDESHYVDIALGGIVALLSGAWKLIWDRQGAAERQNRDTHDQLWTALESTKTDIQQHKVDAARQFVTHDSLQELRAEIRQDFREINAKLDRVLGGR